MTDYCTTCGGIMHGDGEELAGPQGHRATWGRLGAPQELGREPVEPKPEGPADGPIWRSEQMPEGAPRNALWLCQNADCDVLESKGYWKGTLFHVLGVVTKFPSGVECYATWRMTGGKNSGWSSMDFYVMRDGVIRTVTWTDLRRTVKDELGEQ